MRYIFLAKERLLLLFNIAYFFFDFAGQNITEASLSLDSVGEQAQKKTFEAHNFNILRLP